jgi:hypothetical protein
MRYIWSAGSTWTDEERARLKDGAAVVRDFIVLGRPRYKYWGA